MLLDCDSGEEPELDRDSSVDLDGTVFFFSTTVLTAFLTCFPSLGLVTSGVCKTDFVVLVPCLGVCSDSVLGVFLTDLADRVDSVVVTTDCVVPFPRTDAL